MTLTMTNAQLTDLLPTGWVVTFIDVFEAGRVQKHPHARFVNRNGECCLVAAMVNAKTARDVVDSGVWDSFQGSVLEELSRRFESRRLTGQEFYEECLLVLTARRAAIAELVWFE